MISYGTLVRDDNHEAIGWRGAANITSNTTTVVKDSAGILHGITINALGTSEILTIYNGVSASGTKIATITIQANIPFYPFDVACDAGITIVSSGTTAGDYTALYC